MKHIKKITILEEKNVWDKMDENLPAYRKFEGLKQLEIKMSIKLMTEKPGISKSIKRILYTGIYHFNKIMRIK